MTNEDFYVDYWFTGLAILIFSSCFGLYIYFAFYATKLFVAINAMILFIFFGPAIIGYIANKLLEKWKNTNYD